jgi:hypothetical protein
MSIELPDWLRGTLLLGRDGAGNIIPIVVDATGQINVLLRGADVLGTVHTVRTDNVGQLYAILRGAGGVDVSVDAAGNMSAVLKGLYGGVLHTIAVDADGRIEAFIMDSADQWSQTLRVGTAEATSRQNPIHSYDWRGNVIYFCDFERGTPAAFTTLSGAGASVVIDPAYWRNGGYALRLTGGSTVLGTAIWNIHIATTNTSRVGFASEFAITPSAVRYAMKIEMEFAGLHKTFGVGIDVAGQQLQYIDPTGGWVNFHPTELTPSPSRFYKMKMVVDAFTGRYQRCLYNDEEYPMVAYSGDSAAGTGVTYTEYSFILYSRPTFNDVAYLDSFVVTANEPPPP